MNMKTEEILLRTSLQDCREKYDKLSKEYLELAAALAALDDAWAQRVHGQTLERLAKRGGLSPVEIAMNLMRVQWANGDAIPQDASIAMVKSIAF